MFFPLLDALINRKKYWRNSWGEGHSVLNYCNLVMHMIRSWKFSLFIKLHKILEKLKLTSFVGYYCYIMSLWWQFCVGIIRLLPYKEEFVDQIAPKNLCMISFISIMCGFQKTIMFISSYFLLQHVTWKVISDESVNSPLLFP